MKKLIIIPFLYSSFLFAVEVVSNHINCDVKLKTSSGKLDRRGIPRVFDKQNNFYVYSSFLRLTNEILSLEALSKTKYNRE